MYEVSFFHNKTLQPGLFAGNKVLKQEIEPFKFAKKLYWFPTTLNSSKILDQSYFSQLLSELKNDAYLIYDISSEPGNISWVDEILKPLILVLKKNKISLKKLILLTATPEFLYGKCDHGYVFFNDQLYNTTHHYKKFNQLPHKNIFNKHFLSLSRKDTLERRYINFLLHTNKLFHKGIVSHARADSGLGGTLSDSDIAEQDLSFIQTYNLDLKEFLKFGFKKHFLDTNNLNNFDRHSWLSVYNFNIHFKFSESVPVELVNETYAFGLDALYFTEKIVKAILSKNIFLLLGNRFLLSFVKQLGFKTFSHLFDESYDTENDSVKRFSIVFKNLQEFCKIPLSDCKKIYDDNAEILDYNYNHLINTKWDFSIKNRIEKYITKESLQ